MGRFTVIPQMLFEPEDLVTLSDMGIQFEEGYQKIGKQRIKCLRFLNMTECEIFDKLEGNSLLESAESERNTFAARCIAIIFMKLREVQTIQDPATKTAASCALLSAICSLATLNIKTAQRFLALIRQS